MNSDKQPSLFNTITVANSDVVLMEPIEIVLKSITVKESEYYYVQEKTKTGHQQKPKTETET